MAERDTLISRAPSGVAAPAMDNARINPGAFGYAGAVAGFGQAVAGLGVQGMQVAGRLEQEDIRRQNADAQEKLQLITRESARDLKNALAEPLANAAPGTEVEITEKITQEFQAKFDERTAEIRTQFSKADLNPDLVKNHWGYVSDSVMSHAYMAKAASSKKDRMATAYANAQLSVEEIVAANPSNPVAAVQAIDAARARLKEMVDQNLMSPADLRAYEMGPGRKLLYDSLAHTMLGNPDQITPEFIDPLVEDGYLDIDQGTALLRSKLTVKKTNLAQDNKKAAILMDGLSSGKLTIEQVANDPFYQSYIVSQATDADGNVSQPILDQSWAGLKLAGIQGNVSREINNGAFISPLSTLSPEDRLKADAPPGNVLLGLNQLMDVTRTTESFRTYLEGQEPGTTQAMSRDQLDTARNAIRGKAETQLTQIRNMESNQILAQSPAIRARHKANPNDIAGTSLAMAEAAKLAGIPQDRQVNIHPDHLQPLLSALDSNSPAQITTEAIGLFRNLGPQSAGVAASFFYKPDFPPEMAGALFYASGVGENPPDSPYTKGIEKLSQDMFAALTFYKTRETDEKFLAGDPVSTEISAALATYGSGLQTASGIEMGISATYGSKAGQGVARLLKAVALYKDQGQQTRNRNAIKSVSETLHGVGARWLPFRNGPNPNAVAIKAPSAAKNEKWFQMYDRAKDENTSLDQESKDWSAYLDVLMLSAQPNAGAGGIGESAERGLIHMFGHGWFDINGVDGATTRMLDRFQFPLHGESLIPFADLHVRVPNLDQTTFKVMPLSKDPLNTHSAAHQAAANVAEYARGRTGTGRFSNNLLALRSSYRWLPDPENGRMVLGMVSAGVGAENAGVIRAGDAQPVYKINDKGESVPLTFSYDYIASEIARFHDSRTVFQSVYKPRLFDRLILEKVIERVSGKPVSLGQQPHPGQAEEAADAAKNSSFAKFGKAAYDLNLPVTP